MNAPTSPTASFGWHHRIGLIVLLLLLIAIAYQAAPYNGFHFDDADNILGHGAVHLTELSADGLYRAATEGFLPKRVIPNLSFAIDWWRGGGSPGSFQVTNVLIHMATTLAVFWLLLTILQLSAPSVAHSWTVAALSTALWALHPIQVQAVTYVVQRMTSIAAFFMLIAVAAYIRGRTLHKWRWLLLAGVASGAACLSKENAYILPVLFLLAEYILCRQPGERIRTLPDKLLLALPVAAAIYVALDLTLLEGPVWHFVVPGYEHRDFTLTERLLTQPRVIFFHLSQVLLPLPGRFSIEHDFPFSRSLLEPWTTLPSLAGVLVWIGIAIWLAARTKHAAVSFLLLWIPATLAIESTVIPLEMIFEHRMYLPSVGLAGLAALAIRHPCATRHQRLSLGLSAILAALFLLATTARVPAWRSSVTLYEHAVQTAPRQPRAWTNLATAYEQENRSAEAIAAYTRALEIDPKRALAYLNRGSSYRKSGAFAAAQADYRQFIALQPDDFRGPYALGALFNAAGQFDAAESWLRDAARRNSGSPLPYRELALVYLHSGRPAPAIEALQRALHLDPTTADLDYFNALGMAKGMLGSYNEAIAAFRSALEQQPDSDTTRVNLGMAYLRNSQAAEALAALDYVIAHNPRDVRALVGRAEALMQLGRLPEAQGALRSALALDSGNARAAQLQGLLSDPATGHESRSALP